MKPTILLSKRNFDDPVALIERLDTIAPESIVLNISTPHDMTIVEIFSNLENVKSVPVIPCLHIFSTNALALANMANQCYDILNAKTFMLKINIAKLDLGAYLQAFFLGMEPHLVNEIHFIVAAQFFDVTHIGSMAASLIDILKKKGYRIKLCIVFSSLNDNFEMLDAFQPDEEIMFEFIGIGKLTRDVLESKIEALLKKGKPVVISRLEDAELLYTAPRIEVRTGLKGVILLNKVSAWETPALNTRVTRKLHAGDEIYVRQVISRVVETIDGDFISIDKIRLYGDKNEQELN